MGVYINMEMPTRCGRCDFRIPAFDDGIFDHYECRITAAIIDNLGEKMEDCPLVPVPPHGRLIDADALAAEMKKRQDACAEWRDDIKNGGGYGTELYYRADSFFGAMCETKLMLDKMPTIIQAEEGE